MAEPGTWEWRATGTDWRIHHDGGVDAALAQAASALVAADERRWSRFLPDSDVARIGASAGSWVVIDPETSRLLSAAEAARVATRGVFTPLVGARMVAWGYRTAPGDGAPAAAPAPAPVEGELEVAGGAGRERARIPAGTALDLGGIAKAWIAVRVAELLAARAGGDEIVVSAGGDVVAARGDARVGIEPVEAHPEEIAVIVHEGHGVATSGVGRRSWLLPDGTPAHHLIDPATGQPGAPSHASVVASDPVHAEVLAKVHALRPDGAASAPLPVLVRLPDGGRIASPTWAEAPRSQEVQP